LNKLCLVTSFAAAATSSAPFQPWGKAGIEKDSSKSVFVRNLPFDATYEDVASFFSQAGEVREVKEGWVHSRERSPLAPGQFLWVP
jgi:RNA recognition motif-containing protein